MEPRCTTAIPHAVLSIVLMSGDGQPAAGSGSGTGPSGSMCTRSFPPGGRLSRYRAGCLWIIGDSSISTEAIYQYIYDAKTQDREELIACLRRSHKKRKQRAVGRKQKRTKIPNRVSIEDRPQSVAGRRTYGHWEGDSMVSRKSAFAINSLTERKSRLILITRIKRRGATETMEAVIDRLGAWPHKFCKTLTLDNGTENTKHELITAGVGVKCYFAHPYASWERGTNENANGLVRWYFPKGTDFAKITDDQVALVENLLNNRPRKCLGFKTPIEAAASSVALRH